MSERSDAQKEAERAYRSRKESVLVRMEPDLAKRLDAARKKSGLSRAAFIVAALDAKLPRAKRPSR